MAKKPITTDLIVQNQVQVPDLSLVASKLKRVSDETRNTYKYAMNSFKNYCTKNKVSADLDSLLQWLESVQSPSTQSTHIAAVKKVFGEIYKHDPRLIELKEELENIRPVKRDMSIKESSYLSQNEVKELIKVSPAYLKLMVEVLYSTGLRITELLNIKLTDCKLIERKGKKSYYEINVIQKRKKEGTVFINETLYKKVYKFYKGEKFLFEHDKTKYSREHITREIKKYGTLIGRSDIHAHSLRHSFAMRLVNDLKLPIDKVQRAMNHSSAQTTIQFYIHNKPTPEDLGVI